MSTKQRKTMFALGLVFVAIAVVIALSSGDDNQSAEVVVGDQAQTSAPVGATPAVTEPTAAGAAKPSDLSAVPLLVSGKVAKISVEKGENIKLRVLSKEPEELHIHGYDISQELEAGKATTVNFEATIDGVFEIEFEGSGEQVAKLTVNP